MNPVIHLSETFDASQRELFEAFTENDKLESWLTEEADVEPRIGGKYELFWDPTHRQDDSTIGCKVTAIDPPKLIAFEWKGPKRYKQLMNEVDPLTHVTVMFLPCDAEQTTECTEVHLVHAGWRTGSQWAEARDFFQEAWSTAFQELADMVK